MKESILQREIRNINSNYYSQIQILAKQIDKLEKEKKIEIDRVKEKCKSHTYDNGTSSLMIKRTDEGIKYNCIICEKELPLETVIDDYIYYNKKIEALDMNIVPENLKQMLDNILYKSGKGIDINSRIYDEIFEGQCYKQQIDPRDIFNLLLEKNIFRKNLEKSKGYMDIIK